MRTGNLLRAGIISLTLFCGSTLTGGAAPRPPQPPWPEPSLRTYGFDSGYVRAPWKDVAMNEEASVVESWSGTALVRDQFAVAPVVIPLELDSKRPNFKLDSGAIRFWLAPQWSSGDGKSGGGPGHVAHLLQLVSLTEAKAQGKWSLCINETGDTIFLVADTPNGLSVLVQAPIKWEANDWRMITFGYSPTNCALWLDNELIGSGTGLPELAWWEKQNLGLVVGSDIYATADNVAEAQFEELTLLARWPKKSDWQDLYFLSGKRRALMGTMGSKEEEAEKVALLKSAGWLPEEYGVANRSSEGDGPMMLESYAEGALWLEITGVSNQLAYLIVHGTVEDGVYEILIKESLTNAAWTPEVPIVLGATGQDWTAATVALHGRTNELYFWARSLQDTDGDGLPDWWELENNLDPYAPDTGDTGVPDGYKDGDNDGWTNLQEYQNGTSPNQYNTPATLHDFTVLSDETGTYAKLSWSPASGPVTGYTIERGIDNSLISVSSTTFSHIDSAETLPDGLYDYWLIPFYRIRPEYAAGSGDWSPWQAVADLQAPVAQFVAGYDGGARVIVAELPQFVAVVRVGDATYDGLYYNPVSSIDIPANQFTNGASALPSVFVQSATNNYQYVQFILTNTTQSAINPFDLNPVQPFWDGRAQLKDNLRFLLRAATPYNSFGFRRLPSGIGSGDYAVSPTDYAYSSFYSVFENTGHLYAYSSPLLPFQENYLYRNFVFSETNLDSSGKIKTGAFWNYGLFLLTPEQFSFSAPASLGPLASVLSLSETTWTGWCGDWPETPSVVASPDLDLGVTEFEDETLGFHYSMSAGARNWFGLNYQSLKFAWGSNTTDTATLQTGNGFYHGQGGYFYAETAAPQFQTTDYYFEKILSGPVTANPIPGHPSFSVTNLTSLLVASVGASDFQLAGYAKLAVTNGYPGVYGYLGQYFDKAYLTTNGVVTTNETGILSPYGEFFATEPGRIALVTMADIETYERGTAIVHVVSMNVDANHDGVMDLFFGGPDQTTAAKPFTFWVNNDYDRGHQVDFTDWEEDDLLTAGCPYTPTIPTPDYAYRDAAGNRTIPSNRDLEDYARLWMPGLSSLMAVMPTNYTVRLTLNGDGAIRLFRAIESDGGTNYLFNEVVASNQVNNAASLYVGLLHSGSPILLTNQSEHFIWCGAKRGSAEVHLQILDGTNMLADTVCYIDLKDIKEMYERWTAGDNGSVAPWAEARAAVEDLPAGFGGGGFQYSYNLASDSETPYILHVHGWNMERWEKDRFAESAFKRLYWQGYDGRFGSFRWPTLAKFPAISGEGADLNHFDKSEFNAWQSGVALRKLLVSLDSKYPGQVRLSAHSMGNVVAGEALTTNMPLVAVCIAMQAAVPSGAYWLGAPFRAIPTLYFDGTTELYRFYPVFTPSRPYFHFAAGAADYVNFYNQSDWALNLWLTDQNLKPADSLGYSFDISSNTFFQFQGTASQRILTTPTNTFELFAFGVEGQCWALGAQTNVAGVFTTARQLDLDAAFAFGNAHKGHSGQFRSTNMKRAAFWTTYATRMGVK